MSRNALTLAVTGGHGGGGGGGGGGGARLEVVAVEKEVAYKVGEGSG